MSSPLGLLIFGVLDSLTPVCHFSFYAVDLGLSRPQAAGCLRTMPPWQNHKLIAWVGILLAYYDLHLVEILQKKTGSLSHLWS